ncbi:MAG: SGNH/GDSL hydrolase family protein [Acidimicrobiales bacterium]|jgi:lysophospholipase L1-like esterase
MSGRRRFVCAAAVLGLLATACSSTPAAKASTAPPPRALLYVSLGDSYAAGYQPTGPHSGRTGTNGFAYQVPALAAKKGWDLKLVNFGCGGATTESILHSRGCSQLGPGATPYPTESQATAAEAFIRSHRGELGLITVSIGGNDVTACAAVASPIPCVEQAVKRIKRNLGVLLRGLRAAAGRSVRIVGTTYPDVILGLYVSDDASLRNLAEISVPAFRDFINPALKQEYEAHGAAFVDVTAATGAYGSLKQTTTLAPYGKVPLPVAKVCELTYFCQYHDIHPRTPGYTVIATLIVATLPQHG